MKTFSNQNPQITQKTQQNASLNNRLTDFFNLFHQFVYLLYLFMTFFKQSLHDPQQLITISIGIIKLQLYSIGEIVIVISLALLFIYKIEDKKDKKNRYIAGILLVLAVIVSIFNIYYLISGIYIGVGLIVRPIFIILYKSNTIRIMSNYLRIFKNSSLYFLIMWIFILIISLTGMKLMGGVVPKELDIFPNLQETFWNVLYSNSSDGLAYQVISKPNIIFFMLLLIINTILIISVITGVIMNSYSSILQEQNMQKSIFLTLFELVSQKLAIQQCNKKKQSLSNQCKFIYGLLSNHIWIFTVWIAKAILFLIVCIYRQSLIYQQEAYTLVILNIIIVIEKAIQLYLYKLEFWRLFPLEIFQVVTSIISIILFSLTVHNVFTYQTYTKFVIFLLPSILWLPLSYFITLTSRFYNFLQRFRQILDMLLIITFLFAGVGELWFGGKVTPDIQNILPVPLYVYLNFNNTLNSMITLLNILLSTDWRGISQMYEILCGYKSVRLFFVLYYHFAYLICISMILSVICDHIASQNLRDLNKKKYKGTFKQIFKHRNQINSIKQNFLKKLKKIYANYIEVYQMEMLSSHTERYPQIQYPSQDQSNKFNAYSLIYYEDIDQMTFQSVSKVKDYGVVKQGFSCINQIIQQLELKKNFQIQKFFAKQILTKLNIEIQDKIKTLAQVRKKLIQLQVEFDYDFEENMDQQFIKKSPGGINQIKSLIQDYIFKNIDPNSEIIFSIDYDLPQGYCSNIFDIYINNERIGISFRYYENHIISKIKVNKIANHFGIIKGNQINEIVPNQSLNSLNSLNWIA